MGGGGGELKILRCCYWFNLKTVERKLARLEIYIVHDFHPSQSKHLTSQYEWSEYKLYIGRTSLKTLDLKLIFNRLISHKLYRWITIFPILPLNVPQSYDTILP